MPGPGSRTPYAGDLRRDLLDAAIRQVAEEDPAQLSLRAIARDLGVSHAAPKNHFQDKTALFTAIAVEGFDGLAEALNGAIDEHPAPMDALPAAGRADVGGCVRNRGCFRVMWRNDLLDPDSHDLAAASGRAFSGLPRAVAEARHTGWGSAHSVRDLAVYAWSVVHGVAQLLLDGPLGDMDGRSPEALADLCVQLLVRGPEGDAG